MVAALFDPLNLIIVALAAGFLLPFVAQFCPRLTWGGFFLTLLYLAVLPLFQLMAFIDGQAIFEIQTAGIAPPFAINLRFGLDEAWFVAGVNLIGLLSGWYLFRQMRDNAGALSLFLVLILGIDGMIMTRDLFNLFIFVEIVAIATYGLLALDKTSEALSAGFKYVIATSLASTFLLLGAILCYYLTGTLNIDDMLNYQGALAGSLGLIALTLVVTSILIELKPYPANGWGLDVYQNAPAGMAAMVSVGVSAGVFFALYKVLPLLPEQFLPLLALLTGLTFLISNLIGLKQQNARRLLGYSSIAQMSLMAMALMLLQQMGQMNAVPLVVGGLFINHLLAKSGLFWLAGALKQPMIRQWNLTNKPVLLVVFALLLIALVGLPPFPGFWAKWELIMQLAAAERPVWISIVLLGSLLEAAYLFRWLGYSLKADETAVKMDSPGVAAWMAMLTVLLVLIYTGYEFGLRLGVDVVTAFLPLVVALLLWPLDCLPGRIKATLILIAFGLYSYLLIPQLTGFTWLFALLLLGGGWVITLATAYHRKSRPGFYPLLAMLLFSFASLLQASTSLEFFFAWEVMTLSSYFLLARGKGAGPYLLNYLLFSLAAAYFLLAGFGYGYAAAGSLSLSALTQADSLMAIWLLVIGFVIKLGHLGVHIWLPGTYAEAEDDFSALLSAVMSKAAVFGLLVVGLALGLQTASTETLLYLLSWLGMLTALWGALMALFQEDVKKLLAYSSMGQVGYIVAASAAMSHLGWVTAMYLTVNHLLFKGLLFLAIAGVILRTGTRMMYRMGGLINNLPLSFVGVMIGIIAVSGVPPLTGFGSKWLLFNTFIEKGWYWQAALAFFAGAVAFLYLFRLIHTVFLGQRKREHRDLKEAPLLLLVPQGLLIGAIMVFSIYPKWLIEPISNIVVAYFPATLTWDGSVAMTGLGYWDGFLIMNIVGAIFVVLLLVLLLLSRFMRVQSVKQFNIVFAAERPVSPETTHYAYNFYLFYEKALGFLVKPRATAFWHDLAEWAQTIAGSLRVFYTGNGQTYALFILIYFVVIYSAAGGFSG